MADILEEIVAHKRIEVAQFKEALPERDIHQLVERHIEQHPHVPSMRQALMKAPVGIIAEFKRKSPSKGWINQAAQATDIPLAYQQNGATALSILTDEMYFGGNDKFVRQAREAGVKRRRLGLRYRLRRSGPRHRLQAGCQHLRIRHRGILQHRRTGLQGVQHRSGGPVRRRR